MFNDLAFVVMLSSTNSPVRKQSIFQPLGLIECKSLVLSEGGRKVINFLLQIRKKSKNDKIDYEFSTCFLSLGYLLKHLFKENNKLLIVGVYLTPSTWQGGTGGFSPSAPNVSSHWSEARTHTVSWGCSDDTAQSVLQIKACFPSTWKWDP